MEQSKAAPPPGTRVKSHEADWRADAKKRRLRSFFMGLLAGQLIVVGLDLAGAAVLHFFQHKIRVNAPIPFQAIVFTGMTAGILVTALLILAVLGLQGAGWLFGKKKVGFFTAVGRGITRVFKAAWAVGLTVGVVGGTAWLMIPDSERSRTGSYFQEKGLETRDKAKSWLQDVLAPKPKDALPSPPP